MTTKRRKSEFHLIPAVFLSAPPDKGWTVILFAFKIDLEKRIHFPTHSFSVFASLRKASGLSPLTNSKIYAFFWETASAAAM